MPPPPSSADSSTDSRARPTRVERYVGRFGGTGVDDSHSGPATVAKVFGGEAAIISDPLSFPWGSAEEKHWRQPVLYDLSTCSALDLTALLPVLTNATPHDLIIVSDEDTTARLHDVLGLPSACVVGAEPQNIEEQLQGLADAKLRDALLREVLAPIVRRELWAAAGIGDECRRPLRVIDVGAANSWRKTFVPEPHDHRVIADVTELDPSSVDMLIAAAQDVNKNFLANAFASLREGGLAIVLLDRDHVSRTGSVSRVSIMATVDEITGPNRLIEHVWGLHVQPGLPIHGGIIGVRPIGGRITSAASRSSVVST